MDVKDRLKTELKNCNTIKEVISTVDKYYNLDQPLGVMGKAAVINGVFSVINVTGTKQRSHENNTR
jgi:hypothetical protein